MNTIIVSGFVVVVVILTLGCLSNNFSTIYYSTDLNGTTCARATNSDESNCIIKNFGGEVEQWRHPYTENEWNESINTNVTQMIQEAIPGGYSDFKVLSNDKIEDKPNQYTLRYEAHIIYPELNTTVTYSARIIRN